LTFLHKKNPNKGKYQSIAILGPHIVEDAKQWIIYYKEPFNKSHENTLWQFKCQKKIINTYNGILVLHTNQETSDFPVLNQSTVINESCLTLLDVRKKEEKCDEDESDNDDETNSIASDDVNSNNDEDSYEADDDDNMVHDNLRFKEIDDGEDDEPGDYITDDINDSSVSHPKIQIENDMNQNNPQSLLEYEPYDYDAPIIPTNKNL
jgi:hypothetical protein